MALSRRTIKLLLISGSQYIKNHLRSFKNIKVWCGLSIMILKAPYDIKVEIQTDFNQLIKLSIFSNYSKAQVPALLSLTIYDSR